VTKRTKQAIGDVSNEDADTSDVAGDSLPPASPPPVELMAPDAIVDALRNLLPHLDQWAMVHAAWDHCRGHVTQALAMAIIGATPDPVIHKDANIPPGT